MKKIIIVLFILTTLFFIGYFTGGGMPGTGAGADTPIALDNDIEMTLTLDINNDPDTAGNEATVIDESADNTVPFEFVDAHADTITVAMETGQGLFRNNLHVDFERLMEYGAPVQVFAIWCSDSYLSNAFEYANIAIDFFEKELADNSDIIEIAHTLEDLERNARNNKISAILALEGGEPLEGRIENLDHFYSRGVRLIGLTWNHENELGYGVGTGSVHGLKPFGIECVKRMNELGIIIDVSHLNEAGFWDVHRISSKPYIASHSNAFSITPNIRNLKDDQIEAIVLKGGLIGMNLFPNYLSESRSARFAEIMHHIRYFIEIGATNSVVLGCDLDGVPTLPFEFTDVSSLKTLARNLEDEFGENIASSIMSGNFYDFFIRFWGE